MHHDMSAFASAPKARSKLIWRLAHDRAVAEGRSVVLLTVAVAFAIVPVGASGLSAAVSDLFLVASTHGAEPTSPLYVKHEQSAPPPLYDVGMYERPCADVCVSRPVQEGQLTMLIRAPAAFANARGIIEADWQPFNEFDGEPLRFDEYAEAEVEFSAPLRSATHVIIRIGIAQAEWEAGWLIVPEAKT